jgi:glutamate-ammonia-ligase adenylyltransferase
MAKDCPPPYDRDRASRARDAITDWLKEDSVSRDAASTRLLEDANAMNLVMSVAGNSGYLSRLLMGDPERVTRLLLTKPEVQFAKTIRQLEQDTSHADSQITLMSMLRRAKQEIALLIAMADIGHVWSLDAVTKGLSDFADVCLQTTLRWLLKDATARGNYPAAPADDLVETSGLIVIGMGKYGAFELNYSSDIDLIVFFDREKWPGEDPADAQTFFIQLTRSVVKIIQELTADGYVFRVDLRLRPDAGATQVAISTEAAEHYYESMGQNWERAAMIKARPVAGDLDAGVRFIERLSPFVWRKYLDFAAIEDVHSIKRQIHAHGGHGKIAVAGHNIKVGRGGIREIEFFAQTQQLILGGRDPELRGKRTCDMIRVFQSKQMIDLQTADELVDAYTFLRHLEHRLQMIEDQQTHTAPSTPDGLQHISNFCGFETLQAFEQALLGHLRNVQRHYASLFEDSPALSEESGSLVFSGVDDDPDTLATLERMGFSSPKDVVTSIRAWHHGRLRATRGERARQILTKLTPALLDAFGRSSSPDMAFTRFERLLSQLPASVQLFSLLHSNPHLLAHVAEILGTSPRLADYLSKNAHVVEAMLDQDFLQAEPDRTALLASLQDTLGFEPNFEESLNRTRRWAHEQSFRTGVQVLTGQASAAAAGRSYTALAEAVVGGLYPEVLQYVSERHGEIERGDMAVVAMGKLGGFETSATSDLDLIFVYDGKADGDGIVASDGSKPLAATQYFARLSQRFINALTTPTSEGDLYEVDMRLRPSGNSGPIATQLASFAGYQRKSAWTWEHMALTRALVIVCKPHLRQAIEAVISETLRRPREIRDLRRDVLVMRKKIGDEYPTKDPWDLKYVRGGLVDLEFAVQFLQLAYACSEPGILATNTLAAFKNLRDLGVLEMETATDLMEATELQLNLLQVLRIAVAGSFDPNDATPGLEKILCRSSGCASLDELQQRLIDQQAVVVSRCVEIFAVT